MRSAAAKPVESFVAGYVLTRSLSLALALSVVTCLQARASEFFVPGAYMITTETGMPHLEENLRYAITHENRCLTHEALSSAFPILRHESLSGCRLDQERFDQGMISYALSCDLQHGTTGSAQWRVDPGLISGTLNVKLGGKNMTFYQRITARRLGECTTAAK